MNSISRSLGRTTTSNVRRLVRPPPANGARFSTTASSRSPRWRPNARKEEEQKSELQASIDGFNRPTSKWATERMKVWDPQRPSTAKPPAAISNPSPAPAWTTSTRNSTPSPISSRRNQSRTSTSSSTQTICFSKLDPLDLYPGFFKVYKKRWHSVRWPLLLRTYESNANTSEQMVDALCASILMPAVWYLALYLPPYMVGLCLVVYSLKACRF
jgi:hypothetical protein